MELLLVRHAVAVDRSDDMEDAARPLTARGSKRFRKAVKGLEHLELRLDHVLHSPWQRALETAELMAGIVDGALEATPHLTDSPGSALLDQIALLSTHERIGIVGHEPWMSELLSLLLVGETRHADKLRFKKGGVAWLSGEVRPGAMALKAVLSPRILRALADSGRKRR